MWRNKYRKETDRILNKGGKLMKLIIITAGLLGLTACGPPTEFEAGTLLETSNTSPETAGTTEQVMETAENEESLTEYWENFRFSGNPPDVDMEENYVLFIKSGENSCEKEIEDIVTVDNSLKIEIVQEEEECDDLYHPRSIAVALERETAAELDQVLFDGASFQLEK